MHSHSYGLIGIQCKLQHYLFIITAVRVSTYTRLFFFLQSHNDFVAILDLPEGEHQYKFFVDGQWVHDASEVHQCLFYVSNSSY